MEEERVHERREREGGEREREREREREGAEREVAWRCRATGHGEGTMGYSVLKTAQQHGYSVQ